MAKEELFPREYRHEFVVKTIKGLLDNDLEFQFPHTKKEEDKKFHERIYYKAVHDMTDYMKPNITKEERNALEDSLFFDFSNFIMSGIIGAKHPKDLSDHAHSEIKKISDRLDSTNKLLNQIMLFLKGIEDKLDEGKKK